MIMKRRYKVTRVVRNRNVPARYQRSGWIVFDTTNPLAYHPFYLGKQEAEVECAWKNSQVKRMAEE